MAGAVAVFADPLQRLSGLSRFAGKPRVAPQRGNPGLSDLIPLGFRAKTACARRIGYFADSAQAKMTSRNVRTSALDSMPAPIVAEKLILGRLADAVGRQRIDDASDIEEVAVVEIVRDAVAAPSAAAHR